jgi:hypothetical protein
MSPAFITAVRVCGRAGRVDGRAGRDNNNNNNNNNNNSLFYSFNGSLIFRRRRFASLTRSLARLAGPRVGDVALFRRTRPASLFTTPAPAPTAPAQGESATSGAACGGGDEGDGGHGGGVIGRDDNDGGSSGGGNGGSGGGGDGELRRYKVLKHFAYLHVYTVVELAPTDRGAAWADLPVSEVMKLVGDGLCSLERVPREAFVRVEAPGADVDDCVNWALGEDGNADDDDGDDGDGDDGSGGSGSRSSSGRSSDEDDNDHGDGDDDSNGEPELEREQEQAQRQIEGGNCGAIAGTNHSSDDSSHRGSGGGADAAAAAAAATTPTTTTLETTGAVSAAAAPANVVRGRPRLEVGQRLVGTICVPNVFEDAEDENDHLDEEDDLDTAVRARAER